jgi:hypothetical protein
MLSRYVLIIRSRLSKPNIKSCSHARNRELIPFLTLWLWAFRLHVVLDQNMCQHELHQMRREEPTRTSMASVSPSKEIVTRHRQALLLLLKVRSRIVVTVSRCGVSECVVSFCFVVDVRIPLDVVVGRGDPHSARNVDIAKVDAVRSCYLFKCKLRMICWIFSGASLMSYHSMHADNSYRKSHRLFDGGVDQYQLI